MPKQNVDLVPIDATVVARRESDDFMPVFSLESALQRRDAIVAFVGKIMIPNTDYGVIPGTKGKPVLLKPGAERLCSFFGLSPEFITMSEVTDWTGADHAGEPFFYCKYKCRVARNGKIIGEGEGSCSSRESKYRYRNAERVCPNCREPKIIKGKEEYGGGWLCYVKKGGCGAKFKDGDASIEEQIVGRVANPDIADVVNTIQKMAQKRAFIAAILIGINASEFFTQDLEDNAPPAEQPDAKWDPDGDKRAQQVAADKIAAMQGGADYHDISKPDLRRGDIGQAPVAMKSGDDGGFFDSGPDPFPPPDPPFSMANSIAEFGKLKGLAVQKLGQERGERLYYKVLGEHGVKHANELKFAKPSRDCYRAMAREIDAALQTLSDPARPGLTMVPTHIRNLTEAMTAMSRSGDKKGFFKVLGAFGYENIADVPADAAAGILRELQMSDAAEPERRNQQTNATPVA